jgi:hypothetical protein
MSLREKNEDGLIRNWVTLDNLPFNMRLDIKTNDGIWKNNFEENLANTK